MKRTLVTTDGDDPSVSAEDQLREQLEPLGRTRTAKIGGYHYPSHGSGSELRINRIDTALIALADTLLLAGRQIDHLTGRLNELE